MLRRNRTSPCPWAAVAALICFLLPRAFAAEPVPQNDLLNAAVWMQTAVEYRANCLTVYALARTRLDEALADSTWTAYNQAGNYRNLPPAVILDLDETAIDNSPYEAGLVVNDTPFNPKAWAAWIRAGQARAVPGAVEFTRYAQAKGVKVFYVTNRLADQKPVTERNIEALGFPMGGNVDTLLMQNDRPEWTGTKGSRFAYVARAYRVLLLVGDNLGDFIDRNDGSISERDKLFDAVSAHFGHDWIMLANPVYGSWERAAYGQDFKLSDDEKRARKRRALRPWPAKQ
jgi:5'-nucleotidase (lipoprotein e(P4) family)